MHQKRRFETKLLPKFDCLFLVSQGEALPEVLLHGRDRPGGLAQRQEVLRDEAEPAGGRLRDVQARTIC